MSLVQRLADVGLTLPDYAGPSLGAVLPAALDAIGYGHVVTGRDAAADRAALGIPEAKHVVVVLLDGLGHLQLDARKGHAPFLRSAETGIASAGFPTTTATSLGLFGTGRAAGLTGMVGYSARNPTTRKIANLISWDGVDHPEKWQREPSLLAAAVEAGASVTTLGKRRFAGSGLTRAVLSGGEFIGAEHLADRIDGAIAVSRVPGVSYCYWGEIDAAGHKHGWMSDQWVAALEDADRELRRLAADLPAGAELVITADHGMVDVTGAPRWDVAEEPELARGIDLVAGEPRALHLYLDGTTDPHELVARWQARLGKHIVAAVRQDWIDAGIFGPVATHVVDRIGDVVVAMAGRATVVDSRTQTDASMALIGVHGSLTKEELLVPVLTVDKS